MGRKSTPKESPSVPQKINPIDNNPYRKRLRSWKEPPIEMRSNDPITPSRRSTIYTYPIHLNHDHRSIPSSAIISENLTMESAFYRPSISSASIRTANHVNNNHLSTVNVENRKRKTSSSSCESLCSDGSQKIVDEKTIEKQRLSSNNLHVTRIIMYIFLCWTIPFRFSL